MRALLPVAMTYTIICAQICGWSGAVSLSLSLYIYIYIYIHIQNDVNRPRAKCTASEPRRAVSIAIGAAAGSCPRPKCDRVMPINVSTLFFRQQTVPYDLGCIMLVCVHAVWRRTTKFGTLVRAERFLVCPHARTHRLRQNYTKFGAITHQGDSEM